MKKLLILIAFLSLMPALKAQIKAVTETGDEVILFENGTWKYTAEPETIQKDIPTNPEKFKKSENASFLLKSTRVNLGFWLDPKKWTFKKGDPGETAEFKIKLKDGDLYAMVITEKIEIPLESLKAIAIENAKNAASDVQVVKEEYRNVNGVDLLLMQLNGTIQGVKFSYYGYYFSNSDGSVQFVTYTSRNLLEQYQQSAEELINGLVITE